MDLRFLIVKHAYKNDLVIDIDMKLKNFLLKPKRIFLRLRFKYSLFTEFIIRHAIVINQWLTKKILFISNMNVKK